MRRIAFINQKGGVGKTTSTVNLGAALARLGRRVVLVDLDPQANLSMHLDTMIEGDEPSTYSVLTGSTTIAESLRDTTTEGMRVLPSSIDLSGAELELANAFGREMLLKEAIEAWEAQSLEESGELPADYVLIDCPPSLGLLSVNGLVAARETVVVVQTEFFALQGMSKLVDVVQLLRRRLNPELEITGILPCLYDSRLKLAREVLAEIRKYFPGQVFRRPISKNIRLAEAPSYGQTIFQYAPDSTGAQDYGALADEVNLAAEETPQESPQEVVLQPAPPPAKAPARPAARDAGSPAEAPVTPSTPAPSASKAD